VPAIDLMDLELVTNHEWVLTNKTIIPRLSCDLIDDKIQLSTCPNKKFFLEYFSAASGSWPNAFRHCLQVTSSSSAMYPDKLEQSKTLRPPLTLLAWKILFFLDRIPCSILHTLLHS